MVHEQFFYQGALWLTSKTNIRETKLQFLEVSIHLTKSLKQWFIVIALFISSSTCDRETILAQNNEASEADM